MKGFVGPKFTILKDKMLHLFLHSKIFLMRLNAIHHLHNMNHFEQFLN